MRDAAPPALTFPETWKDLRVVLCHDWLTGMRGGERVLAILCEAFPEAPVLTLLHNPGAISDTINRHPIHTSFLQHLPGVTAHYRNLLPLFPAAIRSLFRPFGNSMVAVVFGGTSTSILSVLPVSTHPLDAVP